MDTTHKKEWWWDELIGTKISINEEDETLHLTDVITIGKKTYLKTKRRKDTGILSKTETEEILINTNTIDTLQIHTEPKPQQ